MSSAPVHAIVFEREVDDGTKWPTLLGPWLRRFSSSSASFGLVDDWRPDGSAFKRYGVVVELRVDVTTAVLQGEAGSAKLQKLREAVDLAQLLLVVKPSALKTLLTSKNSTYNVKNPSKYDEELRAMARGVPVELQVRFKFESMETALLAPQLMDVFLQGMDEALFTDDVFNSHWQKLVNRLVHRPEALKRLSRSRGVRLKLVIDSAETGTERVTQQGSEEFFADLAGLVSDAAQHGYTRAGSIGESIRTKHIPVYIDKVELRLRRMHITPSIVEAVKVIQAVGFPVEVTQLSLDVRLITCDERSLNEFVQAMTTRAYELIVETGTLDPRARGIVTDANGQDHRDQVRVLLTAIASIRNLHGVNMGGLLRHCSTPRNREAVWKGLFEDVLSRKLPVEVLQIQGEVNLTEHDGVWITQCAARWHHENPEKKLHVPHLDLRLRRGSNSVENLFEVFDDVDKLSVDYEAGTDFWVLEAFYRVLRFPSLRSLTLSNVFFATMDVLDPDAIIRDRPIKPKLQELELRSCAVMKWPTVNHFLHHLKPMGNPPSELSQTLRVFRYLQREGRYRFDQSLGGTDMDLVDEALFMNSTLTEFEVTLHPKDEADKSAKRKLVRNVQLRKCVLRAEKSDKQWGIAKARNTAFLSTLRHPDVKAEAGGERAQLDATIVRKIFAFCAPYVERKVNFGFLEDTRQ